MKYHEIEFKYDASAISLEKFRDHCSKIGNGLYDTEVYGVDHFYASNNDVNAFMRYRKGQNSHQLTFKKKTTDSDSIVRLENNIDLHSLIKKEDIDDFVKNLGYTYNRSLGKLSIVYAFEYYIFVYYICYDSITKQEIGRFIEIELSEEIDWGTEKNAIAELALIEKTSRNLGLSQEKRLTKSLFEMYRRK
jgi:adenylate cyclase class IV